MGEQPPDDGHKTNILAPYHTHVGIGWYCTANELRFAQEFIDRYAIIQSEPRRHIPESGDVRVRGRMLRDGFGPFGILITRDVPVPVTNPQELPRDWYQDKGTDAVCMLWPWQLNYEASTQTFSADIYISDRQPGLYYVALLVRDQVESIPYSPPGYGTFRATTEGTIWGATLILQYP